mmetsp:Transcript_24344/g.17131  ORF Transcript_24344/g.17131 Transcript_24344/m.17131 type:complete len:81 (+) Transcript_24344:521-763(+)|eukprot:CAMPEP_0116889188 /NCGR_PEP_ID=MMETSP0463-20121206/24563_1 /TAXON_ID=181622 /ORGANISM="Strombidinopsis sp, Strain SopsisLIS2011" /LENGTH=80 /DNA_ID=CAMNT_0004555409 /DNA_START=597 /DNA_END=839 /DNA_ORIENTATION=-
MELYERKKNSGADIKELLLSKIISTRKKIEELEDGVMDELKFWGYQEEVDDKFDYGDRALLKSSNYEDVLNIPFRTFPLL